MELTWDALRLSKETIVIATLDTHVAGEPLRIITGGLPEVKGSTILERRRYMLENLDYVRRALMWEPRGHYNMYGSLSTQCSFFMISGTVTAI
jgi:trans-L-3-hydroxyproline dehydratase